MSDPRTSIGGNLPPVTPPGEPEVLADLKARYPNVETDLADLEAAAKTYPERITEEEQAASLQALLKKASTHKAAWKSWRSLEKKPWDTVAKIVFNFFGAPEDRAEKLIESLKPRYTAFLEMKAEKERLEREAKAEAERKEAERLEQERAAAEKRKAEAEEAERQANLRAEEARQRAEEEKAKQAEAEARAQAAKAEADRIERERRERDKAEKDENASNIRSMKAFMKQAERLAEQAAESALDQAEDDVFDDLIMEGGEIGRLGSKLLNSALLDDEQRAYVTGVRDTLTGWRKARTERMEVEEAEQRRKQEQARAEREAAEAAARAAQRKADDEAAARARAEREAAEHEAEEAKARAKAAQAESRGAAKDARDAFAEQKGAAKDEKVLGRQVDKVGARAARMERRNENATDADLSRTRGEYGTVGSLSGRWEHTIVDEAALRAASGPLGPHFTETALSGAAYHWMAAHREGFTGDRVEGQLPGVVFEWNPESRIA